MSGCGVWLARLWPLVAVVGPALAESPTVSFLTPSKYAAKVGETVMLRLAAGAARDAQVAPWPGDVQWLFVRGGPMQENRHDVQPQGAKDDFVSVELKYPGVTVVGVDRRPTVRELTGAELRALVGQNAGAGSTAEKAKALPAERKLRVRPVASAKTLIRVEETGSEATPSGTAMRKTGQAVELLPLADPTVAQVGSDIPLRAYIDGTPRAGLSVRATSVGTGAAATFTTDAAGSGYFRVTQSGLWRVEIQQAEPLDNDAAADWAIYSATLTFEVPAKGGAQ